LVDGEKNVFSGTVEELVVASPVSDDEIVEKFR